MNRLKLSQLSLLCNFFILRCRLLKQSAVNIDHRQPVIM